jgi:hypothetical protein
MRVYFWKRQRRTCAVENPSFDAMALAAEGIEKHRQGEAITDTA